MLFSKLIIVVHIMNLILLVQIVMLIMRHIMVNVIIKIDHCCAYNETDSTCTNCDTNYEIYNSKCYYRD